MDFFSFCIYSKIFIKTDIDTQGYKFLSSKVKFIIGKIEKYRFYKSFQWNILDNIFNISFQHVFPVEASTP